MGATESLPPSWAVKTSSSVMSRPSREGGRSVSVVHGVAHGGSKRGRGSRRARTCGRDRVRDCTGRPRVTRRCRGSRVGVRGGAGARCARRVAVQPAGVPGRAGRVRGALPGGVFADTVGHPLHVAQANTSVSRRGVLRGVHFADVPPGQAKYVQCSAGAVLDVVVDVRGRLPHLRGVGRRAPRRRDAAGRVPRRGPRARLPRPRRRHGDDLPVLAGVRARPPSTASSPLDPALGLPWERWCRATELVLSDKDAAAPTLAEAPRRRDAARPGRRAGAPERPCWPPAAGPGPLPRPQPGPGGARAASAPGRAPRRAPGCASRSRTAGRVADREPALGVLERRPLDRELARPRRPSAPGRPRPAAPRAPGSASTTSPSRSVGAIDGAADEHPARTPSHQRDQQLAGRLTGGAPRVGGPVDGGTVD